MTELEPLIDGEKIASHLGMSYRNFIDRESKKPGFPRQVRRGVWRVKDINDWINKKVERVYS